MEEQKQNIRPTKKQQELLLYIESFIAEHGYSPSYREIMAGVGYTSVATVALHVSSLIKRGHLRKRDRSARSIEVVNPTKSEKLKIVTNQITPSEEKWLIDKVEHLFREAEQSAINEPATIDTLQTLIKTLRILELEAAAQLYTTRLRDIEAAEPTS